MSYPMPGYTSAAMDPRKPTAPLRTVRSQDRGEVAAALLEHGLDVLTIAEMLDFAELHGDAETTAVRVSYDQKTGTWLADLYGAATEAGG